MSLVLREVKLSKRSCQLKYNLTVPEGEFLSILGTQKSGRSALLHLIAGFEFASSGEIFFRKVAFQNRAPSERPLTIIFQDGNLFNHLNVFENLALGIKGTLQINKKEADLIKEMIFYVGLEDSFSKTPSELSMFQQQKAAIARSIVTGKSLLLLDEPFKNLTPEERDDLCLLLKMLHKKFNLTTVMVVSDTKEAIITSSLATIIHEGRVFLTGKTKDVLKRFYKSLSPVDMQVVL
jgi:thiamine transport system ATP-binding protein